MLLNLLFTNPLIFLVVALGMVVAITIHEFAHALASTWLGDQTAKNAGRLTLNPAAHLSLVGSLMLLLAGFGWGKPVPYNPYNLRYQRWGATLVAIAGPVSNLLLVIVAGIFLKIFIATEVLPETNLLIYFLQYLVFINLMLAVFNLIPIPPLDGSKLLFGILDAPKYDHIKIWLDTRGPILLIVLIIFDSWLNLNIFQSIFMFFVNVVSKILF
ncbi:MAG: site-2 protease family protein [Candidatus Falkowbacteria bacterium]